MTAVVALAGAIAGDVMSDLLEAAESFEVEMDDLAGMGAFIASRRFGWLQRFQGLEAQSARNAADGGRRHADLGGNLRRSAAALLPTRFG